MRYCFVLCFLTLTLSGCKVLNDYYQPPAKRVEQAGVKKLMFGNAHTELRSLPRTGMVRVSHIDGEMLYFEDKDFKMLMENEFLGNEDFIGVSPGLTEFQIEFAFKGEEGSGFLCKGSQLVEVEAGKQYEPGVSFNESEGVFECWIRDVNSGKIVSSVQRGEWSELEESEFTRIVGDWVKRSPKFQDKDIYGPYGDEARMVSFETPKDFNPPMAEDHTGMDSGSNSGGEK